MKNLESSSDENPRTDTGYTRREFVSQVAWGSAGIALGPALLKSHSQTMAGPSPNRSDLASSGLVETGFLVNGERRVLRLDPRVTLLDALREKLFLFGTKKGCDHGQCGACTVLLNGKRINACLILAAMCRDAVITTIEGLAKEGQLHPLQTAFIKHDGFQCGYCTPGQICSAVGLLGEGQAKNSADIRELMSGNICRCGAYNNIVEAIREVGGMA